MSLTAKTLMCKRGLIHFALLYNHLYSNGSPTPTSEETLMLFATYLIHTHKPQSINLYLSALHTLHLEHNLPDPAADALNPRHLMRGTKRVHSTSSDFRLPITPSLLSSFASLLNLSHPNHLPAAAAVEAAEGVGGVPPRVHSTVRH